MEYKFYKEHHHGSLNPNPIFGHMNCDNESGNLGMAIGTLDGAVITTRQEAEFADDDSDDDDVSDDSGTDSDME